MFGYNRIGFGILKSLQSIKRRYLVVDFNPDIVRDLKKMRIPCTYGDADDEALLRELPLRNLKIAISTIPEFETNALLVDIIKAENPKTIVIMRAHTIQDALDLYKKGADYVLTPHFLGGEYLSKMIKDFKLKDEEYKTEKQKHMRILNEMLKKGNDHPRVDKN